MENSFLRFISLAIFLQFSSKESEQKQWTDHLYQTRDSVTKLGLNPSWDAGTSQFKCIDPATVKGSATDEGDKDFCNKVQENLLKVCQPSNEGKAQDKCLATSR